MGKRSGMDLLREYYFDCFRTPFPCKEAHFIDTPCRERPGWARLLSPVGSTVLKLRSVLRRNGRL